MTRPLLDDAFQHHAWATLRVIDACLALTPEQLQTSVPGTYGSILETLRHTIGADRWYLYRLSGERHPLIEEDGMDLNALREAMEHNAEAWTQLVAEEIDPDAMLASRRDDGSETRAPKGIRVAQVLHHGTDHRSQICTALTALGIQPPEIDLWDYGLQAGRVIEVPPTA